MATPFHVVLGSSVPASLSTVDALAQLQLQAKRNGMEIKLDDVPGDLRALIDLVGLTETLGVEP